jgi:hypothetical protein
LASDKHVHLTPAILAQGGLRAVLGIEINIFGDNINAGPQVAEKWTLPN